MRKKNYYEKDFDELEKEDVKTIMEISCQGRGEHILNAEREAFVLGGPDGVKKLKELLERAGQPIQFGKIDPLGWYSLGLRILTFIILKKTFGLENKDFIKMGNQAPAFSFAVKFFFKHSLDRETAFEHISDYWKRNYTCGRLEVIEIHEKKGRHLVMRLYDFKTHPIYCQYFLGYFSQIAKLVAGEKAVVKETKCVFSGDPYDEFLVKWVSQ